LFSKHQALSTKHETNSKIQISKFKNTRQLAQGLAGKLQKDKDLAKIVSRIEVAGPGFINFFLSEETLLEELDKIIKEKDKYGSSVFGGGKTVIIDYSSPNIAKRFSIGHLRSTIIGQALYNLYKFLGYKVIGDNHLGDWGTQFGVLLAQITKNSKLKSQISKLTIDDLEKLYVEFNKKAQTNPKLINKAREWFKKLETGDKEAKDIWQTIVKISISEFNKIYKLLNVKIDMALGESFYEDKMPAVIDEIRKKGLAKKSRGAEIVEFSNLPPAILVKSDGATTYLTRDLATIKYRIDKWDPDLIVYEVGAEQKLHFQQVFETARLMGWGKNCKFVHVAHGLFLFEGKKMSTRKGTTVKLEDVLAEAIKKAKTFNKDEKIAKAVGIGAVKYFDLSHHPTSDIDFRWDNLLSLEGNTGPYLQYTFARTQSVLAKLKSQNSRVKTQKSKINQEEMSLLRSFVRFSEIIITAAKNYSPNLICNYLFDLAQKYNTFYSNHRIIGSKNQDLRVKLTMATGQVIKNGLSLLGIEALERM
jgi:arginyl-tRNA synthetase